MPNRNYQKPPSVRINPGTGKADAPPRIVEKAAWPDASLPGPSQPRDRSMGVRKVRTRPKEQGL